MTILESSTKATCINKGGNELKREDIAFEELTQGWDKDKTKGRSAGECFKTLHQNVSSQSLTIDELIIVSSVIWSIFENEGKLIRNEDLLKLGMLVPFTDWLCSNWTLVESSILEVVKQLDERGLKFREQFYSLYPIAFFAAWKALVEYNKPHGVSKREFDIYNMSVEKLGGLDRFFLCSQWASYWSVDQAEMWAGKFYRGLEQVHSEDLPVQRALAIYFEVMVDEICERADEALSRLGADNRNQEVRYRPYLWLWHRLSSERRDMSLPAMLDSDSRKETEVHVDHCIAHRLWQDLLDETDLDNMSGEYARKLSAINSLGNCLLLNGSVNIAKGKNPFRAFFDEVYGDSGELADAYLYVTEALADPRGFLEAGHSLDEVIDAIMRRDNLIRGELRDFIKGEKKRAR